ncbi:hypothetical protein D3C85_1496330 [compost metagenome]
MTKPLKVTIVEADQMEIWSEEEEGFVFNILANYYFIDGLGRAVWLHSKSRQDCLNYIKDNYDGKYALRTARESKGSGNLTCSGVNSRKGFSSQLKRTV